MSKYQTSYKDKSEWIKYYFSFDGGNNWNRISPKEDHFSDVPTKYYINMDYKPVQMDENIKFLDVEGNTDKIQFKTVLSRPIDIEDHEHFTPRLNNYKYNIKVNNGGDSNVY
ncbi:MAG: hypothetical protein ACOCRO_06695 [Halanaerobiales bacterium]